MAHPQYVVNAKGEKTFVLLPVKEFHRLKALDTRAQKPNAQRLARVKEQMRKDFEEAFDYIAEARAGNKPKLKAKDLLNEL